MYTRRPECEFSLEKHYWFHFNAVYKMALYDNETIFPSTPHSTDRLIYTSPAILNKTKRREEDQFRQHYITDCCIMCLDAPLCPHTRHSKIFTSRRNDKRYKLYYYINWHKTLSCELLVEHIILDSFVLSILDFIWQGKRSSSSSSKSANSDSELRSSSRDLVTWKESKQRSIVSNDYMNTHGITAIILIS